MSAGPQCSVVNHQIRSPIRLMASSSLEMYADRMELDILCEHQDGRGSQEARISFGVA